MKKEEFALENHKKGYNCAQSVLCSFFEELGMEEEQLYKLSEGFGLGMGAMDTCGALTGLFMLIGMKNSGGTVNAGKTKEDTYRIVREYADKFRDKNGSVYCRDLKGAVTGRALSQCDQCIADAVVLAEEFLKKREDHASV